MIFKNLDQHAFTLLELLIAMTMMSIIALSLYTSMSIGFKARESAESRVEKGRAAEIAIDLIRGMLTSSMIPDGILAGEFEGEDEEDEYGFDADSLVFYAADYHPAEDELACDIEKIELGMSNREDTDERVIVRKITTNLLSPKTLDPEEDVLCSGVRSWNLRYYDGNDWVDEWDSTDNDNALPKAVEITIVLEESDNTSEYGGDDEEDDFYEFTEAIILPCG